MRRLTEYYAGSSFPILIADSSAEPFAHPFQNNVQHVYTPGLSFTQKIEHVMNMVRTDYVVLCADDDFILPEAIADCSDFLSEHPDYVSAQGRCLKYHRESISTGFIRFERLYDHPVSVEKESSEERLITMFEDYRSILYAVHRTAVLKQAFHKAGENVSNLYLNEYLTAIVPAIAGKIKEFEFLYQVREYANDSDDKTTDNIDVIIDDQKYRAEFKRFVLLSADNATKYWSERSDKIAQAISNSFHLLAEQLKVNRRRKVSFKKRIGVLIKHIPVIGKKLIEQNRLKENRAERENIRLSDAEQNALQKIETILLKYAKI